MVKIILGFGWISIILVAFTMYLVKVDHAFSKRIRVEYWTLLILNVVLAITAQDFIWNALGVDDNNQVPLIICENIIRPMIIMLLISVTDVWKNKVKIIIGVIWIANIVFAILQENKVCHIILSVFVVILAYSVIANSKKKDPADIVFACAIAVIVGGAALTEYIFGDNRITNGAISYISCIFYYYYTMRTYKRDGLTHLLLRHNLNFEMADLKNRDYDLVLIDVDNFKLINDKYGHDKGDEALVTIVNALEDQLPRGCRMYRFGGDEFVIISKKVSQEALAESIELVNNKLAEVDLRISAGIVKHNAGTPSEESLVEADKAMYENKRLLKSEAIWDDTTGLFNYRGFLDELEIFHKNIKNYGHKLCIVAVDIDHLSNINMAYGYTEGNEIISALARVLKTNLRGRDFIGHLGSDEFAIAIECSGAEDSYIDEFIQSVRDGIDEAYELANKEYSVKINASKYWADEGNKAASSEELVNGALYIKQEEKDNRRKTDIADNSQEFNEADNELVLDILNENKLCYAFQPIVSATDGSILGYESLMRSEGETMVSPLKILKYAEKNKRSYDVEKLTFNNVLSFVKNSGAFPESAQVFINSIPGYFLTNEDFGELSEKYGDIFPRMVLEITEQREVDSEALATLNTRRSANGFQLAIDDYGSGCSNTNSLLRYMPGVVKLDRLLITGIDRNAKKQFFVNSIISFARDNDMKILAEGVETENELRTVIRLGVDMIQGYFTAKPQFEIVKEIAESVKKIIVDENLRVGGNQRVVYTAANNCELSVIHLAMEDYTKINIAGDYVSLNGSVEYTADMVLRIKENVVCNLKLSDVRLNSIDDEPCIDIGENSTVILTLEGQNRLNGKGIHVPESSSLKIIGTGDLEIYVKGHQCCAIGTYADAEFGHLEFRGSGKIDINVDGEECVGIGGGTATENSAIEILSGNFVVNVAGVNAIGIGCFAGTLPINIRDCYITGSFRVNAGTFIGIIEGEQNINIKNFFIELNGSGTNLSGIGSIDNTKGKISMEAGTYIAKVNGHNIFLMGAMGGELSTCISHTRLSLVGEGDNVLGFGTVDMKASLEAHHIALDMVINASNPLGIGTPENVVSIEGPRGNIVINGTLYELNCIDIPIQHGSWT